MSKGSVNKVILIGNVGRDPEVKTLDSGMTIANFSIATAESRKDKEAVTEWHRIIAFGKLAEIIAKWVGKGAKLYVEGKIQTRKWTNKEGKEQSVSEIVIDQLQMLGGEPKTVEPKQEALKTNNDFTDDDIPF